MSKKKSDDTIDVEDKIIKEFGNCIKNADYVKSLRNEIVHTTPKLDIILGGGIPTGSFVVITGPPKSGKSSCCLQIAANAQKIPSNYGNRCIYYFDIEGRIKSRDLLGIKNLDLSEDKFKLIQSSPGNILWGDSFISIAEKLIHAKPGCVFILDSFSSLCTQSRAEADIQNRFRDDAPLLLGSFCKRISQIIPINQSIVIGITHLIANQGGMGHSPWLEASGRKIQYQSDVKLKATYAEVWKESETIVGLASHWECSTSAIGPPGGKTTTWLRFGEGFDSVKEYIEIGMDLGFVKKSGAWFEYENTKVQGIEKLRQTFVDKPDLLTELQSKIELIFKK